MNRKSSVAAIDIPLRDQPVSVAIGCMKTASENIAPIRDAGHQHAGADDDPSVGSIQTFPPGGHAIIPHGLLAAGHSSPLLGTPARQTPAPAP